jgi:orotate phosphoribosyltransferase-like protein
MLLFPYKGGCMNSELHTIPLGMNHEINISIKSNPLNIDPQNLFSLGYRSNNKKRHFMFVSSVLGKHTSVVPGTLADMSKKLATLYCEGRDLDVKDVLVLGFAEAATAMAQCFADALGENVPFIHSTREVIDGLKPTLTFREPHSHAPKHRFYFMDEYLITSAKEIILVDDEITTGNTALNIIKEINSKYPGKKFGLATFLDWRETHHIEEFNSSLSIDNITVHTAAILHGSLELSSVRSPSIRIPQHTLSPTYTGQTWDKHKFRYPKRDKGIPYLVGSGRFGLESFSRLMINDISTLTAHYLDVICAGCNKVLVLGSGEFQYLPEKIAGLMSIPTEYQSITRTPNIPLDQEHYPIKKAIAFKSPLDPTRLDYLYNLTSEGFDAVVLMIEANTNENNFLPVMEVLEGAGFKSCNMVTFCE